MPQVRSLLVRVLAVLLVAPFVTPGALGASNLLCLSPALTHFADGMHPGVLENHNLPGITTGDATTFQFVLDAGSFGENDITSATVTVRTPNATVLVTHTRPITVATLPTNEPAAVNNQVVAWNPVQGDGRVSIKFRHAWVRTDGAGSFELDARGTGTLSATGSCALQYAVVNNFLELVVNDGDTGSAYNSAAAKATGDWAGWSAIPGSAAESGSATAERTGGYILLENRGTKGGYVTFNLPGTLTPLIEGEGSIVPTTSNWSFACGPGEAPVGVSTWAPLSWTGSQASLHLVKTVPEDPMTRVWCKYSITVPTGTIANSFGGSLTIDW